MKAGISAMFSGIGGKKTAAAVASPRQTSAARVPSQAQDAIDGPQGGVPPAFRSHRLMSDVPTAAASADRRTIIRQGARIKRHLGTRPAHKESRT
jgi:hypothetical protein